MPASLPDPTSAEFRVLWTALQQFVDNHDELDPGEEEPADLVIGRSMLAKMDHLHANAFGG